MSLFLSATGKRWQHATDLETAEEFLRRLGAQRGLADATESLAALYLPSLMKDAPAAAARIQEAMQCGERIGIFGDYDCDGITSTAQLVRFFRRRAIEPVVRLPHRLHDGYGLKRQHIDAFYAAGTGLVITVDTGISAGDAITRARELNIDVIILDHHHVPAELPNAFGILHPALCDYPVPHPSAAGVAFEFLHTLEGATWQERDVDLALATFGTIADLVPLLGRNRLLVQEGLRAMATLPKGPVRTLAESVIDDLSKITSMDIAFRIAPRLNAAGRMADPMLALCALLDGGAYLEDLEHLNTQRQQETKHKWADALKGFYAPIQELPPLLSIASEGYAPGIVGLLAGKLTEAFGRPSMAVHINGTACSASLRSPACYNIVEGLERHAHLLTTYGGHAQAAGCTFTLGALGALRDGLSTDIAQRTVPEALLPTLTIDGLLRAEDITLPLCREIAQLGPFGQGNTEPLVLLSSVTLSQLRQVGSDRQHLQAMLRSGASGVSATKVIGFHLGMHAELASRPLDLVCRTGIDTWNGRETAQLQIVDLREAVKNEVKVDAEKPLARSL